ncbi:hypothetical protein M9H77_34141 [Catharanthus roseus]|uniref:Uncharacterized protein n=1 Tax=Catharanthus roseus TaxID=4058 RepID=A0ACB9ZLI5_CATRO|nr:hypothetical protein M9H77_34141 [Catharanthus roseus]
MYLCSVYLRYYMAHHPRRWIYQEGALMSGSSGTSPSSSYSFREIVPERDPILIIDLSNKEDPSEADSDAMMLPEPEGVATVDVEGMDTLAAGGSLLFKNMSDSRPSNYEDEAVSKNSQSRQPEPIRENTPRPEQAMHTVMGNFMIRMTELLETSMTTRRNERVWATGADEALEQFLKFRPPEFYGEAEQETKAKLFLEQLNDIYDTIKWLHRERQLLAQLQPSINVLDKDHGNPDILRDPVGRKRLMPSNLFPSSLLQQQQTMHRSCAPYRYDLFKTVYNCCKIGFGRTQSPVQGPLPLAWTIQIGRVDPLEEGRRPRKVWTNRSSWTPHHALRWDAHLVESQEGLETKVDPRADLIGAPEICSLF